MTLLLPVYNEAGTIELVVSSFYDVISKRIPFKIAIAEDGSTDDTKEILRRMSKVIPMNLILGDERKGYSKGLVDGLENIDTEFVVFADSDGQHMAEDFWKLWESRDKYDIVSGWRLNRADAFHRKLMSAVFQWMAKTLFKLPSFHDITGPYKLMRTEIAKEIAKEFKYMKESFWIEFTIRACGKHFKILEIPVNHRDRVDGGSTRVYKLSKVPNIALSQFTSLFKLWMEKRTKESINKGKAILD